MKRLILSALFFAGLALLGLRPAMAVMIDFVPQGGLNMGDPLTAPDIILVDVVVSDLGGEIVSAYDLDITFDDSVLAPFAILFSGELGLSFQEESSATCLFCPLIPPPAGVLDVAEVSLESDADLLALQGGNAVTLFTIDFDVIGDGDLNLGFIWNEFNDVKGSNNRVIIPVPEPGTLLLMAAAIAGLGYSRRRRAA